MIFKNIQMLYKMFNEEQNMLKMIDNEQIRLYNVHIETKKCLEINKTEEILCRATQNIKGMMNFQVS